MKYINQLEYPLVVFRSNTGDPSDVKRNMGGTFKASGCGVASAVMIADRLLVEPDFDIFDGIRMVEESHANYAPGTDHMLFAPWFAEKMGLDLLLTDSLDEVRNCLSTGGAVMALSTGDYQEHVGLFTHGGHFIAIVSQLRDGRVAVLDPAYSEGKFEEEGRKGLVRVDGDLIYCTLEQIAADWHPEKLAGYLPQASTVLNPEQLEHYVENMRQFACFWKHIEE